ncbi:hypothetical protein AYO21_12096 [Fonsecaea monophora]|uniref:Uncharacterized protein n=1 Tax=Fonsecaea monophora TaxID=254056 RepID=A0A177EQT5_9EURO|nr:hypothetical protein AYO21_12096 [Fonsecaea monophora]OAG33811.1 hypothetical protein AYO21_12096 [Fonsecaea monophora]
MSSTPFDISSSCNLFKHQHLETTALIHILKTSSTSSTPHLHPQHLSYILNTSSISSRPRPHPDQDLIHILKTSSTSSTPHLHPQHLIHILNTSSTSSTPHPHPQHLIHILKTSLSDNNLHGSQLAFPLSTSMSYPQDRQTQPETTLPPSPGLPPTVNESLTPLTEPSHRLLRREDLEALEQARIRHDAMQQAAIHHPNEMIPYSHHPWSAGYLWPNHTYQPPPYPAPQPWNTASAYPPSYTSAYSVPQQPASNAYHEPMSRHLPPLPVHPPLQPSRSPPAGTPSPPHHLPPLRTNPEPPRFHNKIHVDIMVAAVAEVLHGLLTGVLSGFLTAGTAKAKVEVEDEVEVAVAVVVVQQGPCPTTTHTTKEHNTMPGTAKAQIPCPMRNGTPHNTAAPHKAQLHSRPPRSGKAQTPCPMPNTARPHKALRDNKKIGKVIILPRETKRLMLAVAETEPALSAHQR